MSLVVRVPVVRVLRPSCTACADEVMAAPLRSVLPLTLIWKPPSPASMRDCSVTLA
ncbi:hypothetical protein D9M68_578570 [compost metagenome]